MRKLVAVLILVVIFAAAAGGIKIYSDLQPASFDYDEVKLPDRLPYSRPPADMSVSVLATGQMYSDQAFSFRGGKLGVEQISAMDVLLIQHPKGDFLIDTGFGRNVDAHFQTTPLLMQLLSRYKLNAPALDQLEQKEFALDQLAGIILTHAHWDHISGIPDFPEVPVWIIQEELDFVRSGDEHTALARSFENVDYLIYSFDDGPYMGYPESLDVYRDGSLVLVPIGGHTPGSIGVFVTLPSGRRLMLVGDIVWAKEGIDMPAERPPIPRRMVDYNAEGVRQAIGHLHQLQQKFPEILMIPAHDRRVFESLAQFPAVEK